MKKYIIVLISIMLLIAPLFLINKHTLDVIKEQENIRYIYLDPGHGGKDGGAISNTGIYEKDIN